MLKIADNFPASHDAAFILENGIELYKIDWNGEVYRYGWDSVHECTTRYEYRPVYNDADEIIGFEEGV